MCRQFALEHALRSACANLDVERQSYNGVQTPVASRSLSGISLIAQARYLKEGVWRLDGDDSFDQIDRDASEYARLLRFSPKQLQYGDQWARQVHEPANDGVLTLTQIAAWPPA